MTRKIIFGLLALAAPIAISAPAAAQSYQDEQRWRAAQARYDAETERYEAERDRWERLQGSGYAPGPGYAPPPPPPGDYRDRAYYGDDRDENGYDPSRYYRPGAPERVLAPSDRVYAGNDGRYYCRRSDGTTGLIVGGAAGGVLGNVIDGGHSRAAGTLIGAAVGALAGKAVDQSNSQIRCR